MAGEGTFDSGTVGAIIDASSNSKALLLRQANAVWYSENAGSYRQFGISDDGTGSDFAVFKNTSTTHADTSSESGWSNVSQYVDDRGTAEPLLAWKQEASGNGKLFCFGAHGSDDEFRRLDYTWSTDSWTKGVTEYDIDTGTSNLGSEVSQGGVSNVSLCVDQNGNCIVAWMNTSGAVKIGVSSDGTSGSWTTHTVTTGMLTTASLQQTYVLAFNDGSDKVGVFYQNATTTWGFSYATTGTYTSWTDQSIAESDSDQVDNHVDAVASSDGTIYCTVKDGDDHINLLRRTSGGTLSIRSVNTGGNATTPQVAVDDTNDKVYLFFTDTTGTNRVVYQRADTSDLTTWSSAAAAIDPTEAIEAPQATSLPCNSDTGIIILAQGTTSSDVHWNYMTLPAAAGATEVPTGGSTVSASGSATATLSVLRSITSTAASTATETASLGRIKTATETVSASGSETATLNRLASLTDSAGGVGALTATLEVAGVLAEITETCAASGSLTVTLQRVRSMSSTAASTGAETATLDVVRSLTSTAASTGTQTSSLGRVRTATETAASSGALTATLNRLASLTETCAASGALTATLEVAGTIAEISSTAASTGDLTAALNRLASLTETAASSGTLTATANRLASHTETCAGVGALTATLELATGPKAITETCAASGALTATLGRVRSLSETCAAVGAETATLTAIGPGIALLTSTASASGDLTASLSVLRSITSTMAGSGTLSETLSRLASITETAASSGALTATLATRPLAEITETCAGVGASTAALETQSDFVEGATRVFSSTARGRTFTTSSGKTFT